ncbi:hypothetical protein [Nocardiopsis alborubida]|uniref:Uncharacterized protein n=1 Tax=Nocardiopsis alborubida TaxID=146802 RepID=A0A7X6M8Q0_9ACTN|nr:hypothetical protein [Nocardiopsis alborubida]NKY96768.1 hypothetical protein [Nocardiopsis alborubida]
MSRTTALTKLRTTATGEGRQTAAKALRALPPHLPPIPEASDGQARLESLFLANLNRLPVVSHPTDPPFAIRRCTPGVTDIVIEIARPHLSAVLNETLPRAVPDQDLDGIPGIRAHHHRGHLVLEHLRLAGRIRIPLTSTQWHRTRSWMLTGLPAGTVAPWATRPHEMLPLEEEELLFQAESEPGPGAAESARMSSALLRRLRLLHGAPIPRCWPFYNVWPNPVPRNSSGARLLNLEWGSRPTALELAELLTDARSPIALPAPLRTRTHVHAGDTPWVRLHAEHDSQLLLRHNPLPSQSPRPWSSEHGPQRPPWRMTARADELSALDLVMEALTGAHPLVDRSDLRVARRREGGWDLFAPQLHFGLLEHLRQVAHSPACPHLWPADIEDMLSPYGEFSIVRVRGVDIVFHDPTQGQG